MHEIPRLDIANLMGKDVHIKTGEHFSAMPLHWHDYFELIFYEDADVTCTINGNMLSMGGGSLYLLTPFDFHRTENNREDGSISFVNVSFSRDAVENSVLACLTSPCYIKNLSKGSPIYKILTILMNNENKLTCTEIGHLLCALISLVSKNGSVIKKQNLSSNSEFIKNVCEYLSKNFTNKLTLNDIASEMHLAPAYFSNLFSKTFGCTFISYLTGLRLNFAKQLLISTDMSITQVCYDCGFSSFSHFLREFKNKYGKTPSDYRKNSQ